MIAYTRSLLSVSNSIPRVCHVTVPVRTRATQKRLEPTTDERIVPIRKILKCPLNCLCSKDIKIDYKNVELLSQFISPLSGRILSRFSTGICLEKQEKIALAIIRARNVGLMPYSFKLPAYISPELLPTPHREHSTTYTKEEKE